MNELATSPIFCVEPEPAPVDSFIGPEFLTNSSRKNRSENKCNCTACGAAKDSSVEKLYSHPVLHVLICHSCYAFYHTGSFTKDEEGVDEQCRWCGQGGNLLMCDTCSHAFCNYCIKRNFSKKFFSELLQKTWSCFVCDPSQLKSQVEECQRYVCASKSDAEDRANVIMPESSLHEKEQPVYSPDDNQIKVLKTLTEENKLIDNIIEPLEMDSATPNQGDIAENHDIASKKMKVTPITILRNKENYVIQPRSMSCDESHSKNTRSRKYSDPESSTENIPGVAKKTMVKVREVAKVEKSATAGPFVPQRLEEYIHRGNGDGIKCVDEALMHQHSPEKERDEEDVSCKTCDSTLKGGIEDDRLIEDDKQGSVDKPQHGKEQFSTGPSRRNVGKRTGQRAMDIESNDRPSTSQISVPQFQESQGQNNSKIHGLLGKLDEADECFLRYLHFMKELVADECSVNYINLIKPTQSPSQYSRYRAAKAILDKVKKASKRLIRFEHHLRATKAQLGTIRNVRNSSSSSSDDFDGSPRRKKKFVRPLINGLPSSSRSRILEPAVAEPADSSVNEHDKKLSVDPLVLLEKLNDQDLKALTVKSVQTPEHSLSENSFSSLDSDSSKHHAESDDDSSTFENKSSDKKDTTSVNQTEQKPNSKKRKRYESDGSDYNMDDDTDYSEDIDTDVSSITGSDTNDFMHCGSGIEDDNTIAKNLLLQRMKGKNLDSEDSDVENMIGEKIDRIVNNNKVQMKSTETSAIKATNPKKAPIHPLLTKRCNVGFGDDNNVNCGKNTVTKVKKRKISLSVAPDNKKNKDETFEENEISDQSLTSDSDDGVVKKRLRSSAMKKFVVESDSDSDKESRENHQVQFSNMPSDDDNEEMFHKKANNVLIKPDPDPISSSEMKDVISPKKQGRKNIRKIMNDDEVSQSTQQAKLEEIMRRKRLEQQKEEEKEDVIIIDEETKKEGIEFAHLVLSKNPLVEVHKDVVAQMKPHQCEGVRFIWDNLIENVSSANEKKGTGCILSHCMGLGKTLQTISFLHTVIGTDHLPGIRLALVLCPFGIVNNWVEEFRKWLPKGDNALYVTDLSSVKPELERVQRVNLWRNKGGVLVIGYGLFRTLLSKKHQSNKNPFVEGLLNPGPDILVCDEGHVLKNSSSVLASTVHRIITKRRLILTGTPLQNNMVEYHCMVSLVKPKLLGDLREFKNRFVNPIENGQHVDSTERDVRIMKKRSHVLHEMLAGCVQRKDYSSLKNFLPPKYEYTLKVRLSELQIKLYKKYLSLNCTGNLKSNKACLFKDFNKLLLLVCHPRCVVLQKELKDQRTVDEDKDTDECNASSSDESVILISDEDDGCDRSVPTPSTLEDVHALTKRKLRLFIKDKSGKEPETWNRKKLVRIAANYLDENFYKTKEFEESLAKKSVVELKTEIKNHNGSFTGCTEKQELISVLKSLVRNEAKTAEEWYEKLMPSQEKLFIANEHGGKIMLMLEILYQAAELGDKVVIFSQSLLTLDLIEKVLWAEMKEGDKTNKFKKWVREKDYYRLDGSTPGKLRSKWISLFNNPRNDRVRLFLISTRAGGIGVNLIGANRAIVFDASWNPSHDIQSIFRIYRFGQRKPCYIYRLVAQGTMEEKIYERQVVKRSLSYRVVDEQQISRHFSAADIAELYTFKPDQSIRDRNSVPDYAPPKDSVLATILNSTDLIVSFHEPDSLLDHQVSEELTEAERKAAWDEYDKEQSNEPVVPKNFTDHLNVMPQQVLLNFCQKGNEVLNRFGNKISQIQSIDSGLDSMTTEIRMRNRSLSTEHVTMEAVQQKLNNHIQLRRLSNALLTVKKFCNSAESIYKQRFPNFQYPWGIPGNSTPRTASSAQATSTASHSSGVFNHARPQQFNRPRQSSYGFQGRPSGPYQRRPRPPPNIPSSQHHHHSFRFQHQSRMPYTVPSHSK